MEDVLKQPGSLLLTVIRRCYCCNSYLMFFGVGVSCRILYSFVGYLYVSGSGSVTSVGEERELIYLLLFT